VHFPNWITVDGDAKMRHFIAPVLLCSALNALDLVTAQEPESEQTDRLMVSKFLKNHVMDKTVAKPKTTSKLADNKVESDKEERLTFNNFTETPHGFNFDETMVIKETRYDLDANGKRLLSGRETIGTAVFRYEIRERVSTQKLTGTFREVSKTFNTPSREGVAILITAARTVEGKLLFSETVPGYLDLLGPNGKYVPGSWDSKGTFSMVEGKLQAVWETTLFDVDPDTLNRTPRKDKLPPSVFKELEQKLSR
jgi:hypothetical protein